MPEVSNAVLAEKIDNLQLKIDAMSAMLAKVDGEQRQSELDAVRDHTRIENKADAAHTRIDTLVGQLTAIEKEVPSLIIAYRIMAFIGSALGLSVIALLWALITGQAKIAFTP